MSTPNPETKILELERKIKELEAQLEKANRVIDAFKKISKPPLKIKYNPGYTPDRNM